MNPATLLYPCLQIIRNTEIAHEVVLQLMVSKVVQKLDENCPLKDPPSLDKLVKPFTEVYNIWNLVAGSEGIISKGKGQSAFDTQGFRSSSASSTLESITESYDATRDALVSTLKNFITGGLAAEDNESNLNAIQEFSKLLSRTDDMFWEELCTDAVPVCSRQEKKSILRLQSKIANRFAAEDTPGSCLLTSTVAALLLPTTLTDLEIPLAVFDSLSNFLHESEAQLAHPSEICKVGNAFRFNTNTKYLIANARHQNIFQAASSLLFKCENAAEIIQATCYNMLLQNSQLDSEALSWSQGRYKAAEVKLNVLGETDLPLKLTIDYMSRLLKRNIVVHLGKSEGSKTSLLFGNFHNRTPLNILILGDAREPEIYSLVPVQTLQPTVENESILQASDSCCQSFWNGKYNPGEIDFGDFGHQMEAYFQKCYFCVDFDREYCKHITHAQFEANYNLMRTMVDKKYGNFSARDVKSSDIDETIMQTVSSVADNFVIIKTEKDNDCLFHSVAFCMTTKFALTLPLRRAVAVEFKENESLYTKSLEDANVTRPEIDNIRSRLNSFTQWGNEYSLAVLSRIIGRKIILFGSNNEACADPLKWHVTYDISKHMSRHYPPIFVLLRNKHFHALIPRNSTFPYPEGRDQQFRSTQIALDKFVVFTDHNYDSRFTGKILGKLGTKNNDSDLVKAETTENEIIVLEDDVVAIENDSNQFSKIENLQELNPTTLDKNQCLNKEILEEMEELNVMPLDENQCSKNEVMEVDEELNAMPLDLNQCLRGEIMEVGGELNVEPLDKNKCSETGLREIEDKVVLPSHVTNQCAENEIMKVVKEEAVEIFPEPLDITENQVDNLHDSMESNNVHTPTKIVIQNNGVISSLDVNEFTDNILEAVGLSEEFSQKEIDLYTTYLNAIKFDVAKLQSMKFQEQYIRVFMQRSLFESFWKSNLLRGRPWSNDSAVKRGKWKTKAKQVLKVQGSATGRRITKEFLTRANLSSQACDLYNLMMEQLVEEQHKRNNVSSKLKREVERLMNSKGDKETSRSCPEYTQAGLEYSKKQDEKVFTQVAPVALVVRQQPIVIQRSASLAEVRQSISPPIVEVQVFSQECVDKQPCLFNPDTNAAVTAGTIELDNSANELTPFSYDGEIIITPGSETTLVEAITLDDVNEDVMIESMDLKDHCPDKRTPTDDIASISEIENDFGSNIQDNSILDSNSSDENNLSDYSEKDEEEIKRNHKKFLAESMNFPEEDLNYVPPNNFEITLTKMDLLNCFDFDKNIFKVGKWADVISAHLTDVQKTCSFNAEGSPDYYKNPEDGFCRMRGHCGGKCELKFSVKVMRPPIIGKDLSCDVTSTGRFTLIQLESTSRQLKGDRRKEVSKRLVDNMPIKILIENMSKATFLRHLHVNQEQFSLAALQQLRHETIHSNDMFKDLSTELNHIAAKTERSEKLATVVKGFLHMRNEEEGNVQIHMYTEMALKFLIASNSKPGSTLFVDATGSVCNNVNNKRVLFYLALLQTPEGEVAPICSSIAHRGRAIDIADLFIKVKGHVKALQPSYNKPLAPVICVDYSMAMVQGVLQGANTMQIKDYLKHTYDVLAGTTSFDNSRSVVFVCSSHLIKSFSRLMGKHLPNTKEFKDIKSLAIHSLARLQSCNDLESFHKTVTCIAETFGLEYADEAFIQRNKNMLLSKDKLIDEEKQNDFDLGGHEIEDFNDHALLRECSSFYHIFRDTRAKTKTQFASSSCVTKNRFYSPIILDSLQNYYVPYFGLWGSAILYKTERHFQGSLTTGPLEGEFNLIKGHLLKNQKLPITNYIDQHYEYYTGRLFSVFGPASQLRRRNDKREKRREKRYDATHKKEVRVEDREEEWQRKMAALDKNIYIGRNVFDFEKKNHNSGKHVQNTDGFPGYVPETQSAHVPVILSDEDNEQVSQESMSAFELGFLQDHSGPHVFEEKEVFEILNEDEHCIEDVFAKLTNDSAVGLSSKQLADICNEHYWIETQEMEFMMNFAKNMYPNTDYYVSNYHYAWKQVAFDEMTSTTVFKWRSTKEFGYKNPDEALTDIGDPVIYNKILHPLIVHNHWSLLDINKEAKTCTLYDSLYDSDSLLEEIRNEAIKFFVHPSEDLREWVFTHGKNVVRQVDSSMCGLHLYELSKLIMSGNEISWNKLRHLNNNKKTRLKVVRELLHSTCYGRHILREVKDDDLWLERALHDIHYDCEAIQDRLQKDKQDIARSGCESTSTSANQTDANEKNVEKGTVSGDGVSDMSHVVQISDTKKTEGVPTEISQLVDGCSSITSLTEAPIEALMFDYKTADSAMELLQHGLGLAKTGTLLKQSSGVKNVHELLRRMDKTITKDTEKSSEENVDSDDFEFDESELDKWDEYLESTSDCLMSKLVPQYKEKERLLQLHKNTVRSLDYSAMTSLCEEVLPELTDIRNDKLKSIRHETFFKTGINKSELHVAAIVDPFTEYQDEIVRDFIFDHVAPISADVLDPQNQSYVNLVLKPEAYIRIYAKCNNISKVHTVTELKFGACYQNNLSEHQLNQINSE